MSDTFTIYHNPRCSKSRQTLKLLEERGITPKIVLYLEVPPTIAQLKRLAKALAMSPAEFIRTGEADYKNLNLKADGVTDAQRFEAMSSHPKLIERPIVVKGSRAVLGRPPENVLSLLEG